MAKKGSGRGGRKALNGHIAVYKGCVLGARAAGQRDHGADDNVYLRRDALPGTLRKLIGAIDGLRALDASFVGRKARLYLDLADAAVENAYAATLQERWFQVFLEMNLVHNLPMLLETPKTWSDRRFLRIHVPEYHSNAAPEFATRLGRPLAHIRTFTGSR